MTDEELSNGPADFPLGLTLFLGQSAVATWLWFAFASFTAEQPQSAWRAGLFGLVFAAAERLLTYFAGDLPVRRSLVSLPLLALAGAAASLWAGEFVLTVAQGAWLTGAATVATLLFRFALNAAGRVWPEARLEFVRWIVLGATATCLFLPFYRPAFVGGQGSLAPILALADFTQQWRHGEFPAWIGQTNFTLDGVIDPRSAGPSLLHLAGAVDLLTSHVLSPNVLKNLLMAVIAQLGAGSAYLALRFLLPSRPWTATGLALVWLASPGMLAPLFAADLEATVAALIFVPPVLVGLLAFWRRDGVTPRLVVSAGVAGAWFGQPDVAAWLTLLALAVTLAKAAAPAEGLGRAQALAVSVGSFLLVGTYPIFASHYLGAPQGPAPTGSAIAALLARDFPNLLAPVTPALRGVALFQPGRPAFLLFLLALPFLFIGRVRGTGIIIGSVAGLGILLCPVPGVSPTVWAALRHGFLASHDDTVLHAVAPIAGFILIAAFALAVPAVPVTRRAVITILLALSVGGALALSVAPLREYNRRLDATNETNAADAERLALDGASRTQALARPQLEFLFSDRLLERASLHEVIANATTAAPPRRAGSAPGFPNELEATGELTAGPASPPKRQSIGPDLILPPGTALALRVEFIPAAAGTLQVTTTGAERDYLIPTLGDRVLILPFDQAGTPRALHLTLSPPTAAPAIGRYLLYAVDPGQLPISAYSQTPYKATVSAPLAAWVETSRHWIEGYRATVGGARTELQRSPSDRVLIAVPAGPSKIRLDYSPPLLLAAAYWINLLAWSALLLTGLFALARRPAQSP